MSLAAQPPQGGTPPLPARPLSQMQVYAQLDRCKAMPDFNNYLAYIFASGEGLPVEVSCCQLACRRLWLRALLSGALRCARVILVLEHAATGLSLCRAAALLPC